MQIPSSDLISFWPWSSRFRLDYSSSWLFFWLFWQRITCSKNPLSRWFTWKVHINVVVEFFRPETKRLILSLSCLPEEGFQYLDDICSPLCRHHRQLFHACRVVIYRKRNRSFVKYPGLVLNSCGWVTNCLETTKPRQAFNYDCTVSTIHVTNRRLPVEKHNANCMLVCNVLWFAHLSFFRHITIFHCWVLKVILKETCVECLCDDRRRYFKKLKFYCIFLPCRIFLVSLGDTYTSLWEERITYQCYINNWNLWRNLVPVATAIRIIKSVKVTLITMWVTALTPQTHISRIALQWWLICPFFTVGGQTSND